MSQLLIGVGGGEGLPSGLPSPADQTPILKESQMNHDNLNEGYLSLYRSLREHFLWTQVRVYSELEAWIDILFEVRWKNEPKQKSIKGRILYCNRGESLYSVETWAKRWGWSPSRARRYLEMLKNAEMIQLHNEVVTTRLFVVNYTTYQDWRRRIEEKSETDRRDPEEEPETKESRNHSNQEISNPLETSNDVSPPPSPARPKRTRASTNQSNVLDGLDAEVDKTITLFFEAVSAWPINERVTYVRDKQVRALAGLCARQKNRTDGLAAEPICTLRNVYKIASFIRRDDFWGGKGNIQSIAKLNDKCKSSDDYEYDRLLAKASQ